MGALGNHRGDPLTFQPLCAVNASRLPVQSTHTPLFRCLILWLERASWLACDAKGIRKTHVIMNASLSSIWSFFHHGLPFF